MKETDAQIKWDIGWINSPPSPDRAAGDEAGITFFVYCMHCHHWCDSHMLKCDSAEELERLYAIYAKRLKITMFPLYPEDFKILAERTWKDPEYQAAREEKRRKKTAK